MKKIWMLLLFSMPLAAQVSKPVPTPVSAIPASCPIGNLYQITPGHSGAGNVYGNAGTDATTCALLATPGGGGGGTPGGSTGQIQYNDNGVFGGIAPFAADVVAQCGAKCDGSTDDHAAIQACLDNNAAIFIPTSPGGLTQCNLGTVGITMCSASNHSGYNAIYGNGQYLAYSGSGNAVTNDVCTTGSLIRDVLFTSAGATGTPTLINVFPSAVGPLTNINYDIDNIADDGSFPAGFAALSIGNVSLSFGVNSVNVRNFNTNGDLNIPNAFNVDVTSSAFNNLSLDNTSGLTLIESFISGNAVISGGSDLISNHAQFYGTFALNQSSTFSSLGTYFSSVIATDSSSPAPPIQGDGHFSSITGAALFTGTWAGKFSAADATYTPYFFTNGIVTNILYSVAGTPLPTCTSGLSGTQLQVSDATLPTFLGTYTGSGAVKAAVLCNGTNWVTY